MRTLEARTRAQDGDIARLEGDKGAALTALAAAEAQVASLRADAARASTQISDLQQQVCPSKPCRHAIC